jgi:hypothetical protein
VIRDRSLLTLTTAESISLLGSSFSGLALPWLVAFVLAVLTSPPAVAQ